MNNWPINWCKIRCIWGKISMDGAVPVVPAMKEYRKIVANNNRCGSFKRVKEKRSNYTHIIYRMYLQKYLHPRTSKYFSLPLFISISKSYFRQKCFQSMVGFPFKMCLRVQMNRHKMYIDIDFHGNAFGKFIFESIFVGET